MGDDPGPSVATQLVRGPLPVHVAVSIAQQVASALSAAHARGIIHCDVNPGARDDEHAIRKFLQSTLKGPGYNLLVARDGLEASEIAASHPGTIDLLLTDVQMPELDGIELASAFAKSRPNAKIIFITGNPDKYAERLVDETVVAKLFDRLALKSLVRAKLGQDPR
jgi:CheY-like chemotaxis protein